MNGERGGNRSSGRKPNKRNAGRALGDNMRSRRETAVDKSRKEIWQAG